VSGISRAAADSAVAALYREHYHALVRLSALLLRDEGAAEEVVQDSFVALHGAWGRIADPERAVAYLRRCVVNRSRSVLRRRGVAERRRLEPEVVEPSAEAHAVAREEAEVVMACLRRLPARQREALVLRYYAELSEAEIADAMKVSRGAVKAHTARGRDSLRLMLREAPRATFTGQGSDSAAGQPPTTALQGRSGT
jgi:RNA polymerase sigma-70 factor (sigma-E family)